MDTLTFINPTEDAYVSQFYANTNFGGEPYLYTNRYQGPADEYQSLLKFDGLHNDFFCDDRFFHRDRRFCKLRLHIYRNELPFPITLFVHRVLGDWSEFQVTWNTRPAIDPVPIGSVIVHPGNFTSIEIDINCFDKFLIPFSVLLKCDVPENSLLGFFSRQFHDPSFWPQLLIAPVRVVKKPTVKVSGPLVTLSSDLVRVDSEIICPDRFIPVRRRRLCL